MAKSAKSLQQRVTELEAKLEEVAKQLPTSEPGWKKVVGLFGDDPADARAFDEAMRLGRAYRESLRPKTRSRKSANARPRH
ncbi:MAG: hypothetical protein FD138_2990 [Planctomycetota bacterium]|nr:MAG: hypothetical protein FD138_2990 [Planctomycetota bacterium]